MNETEALLKIASAIEHLASAVGSLGTIGFFMLLFKNMGTSSSSLDRLSSAVEKLLEKGKNEH